MGLMKWGMAALRLAAVAGLISFAALSFRGDSAQAAGPRDGKARAHFEEVLAQKLGVTLDRLRSAQKSVHDQLKGQDPSTRLAQRETLLAQTLGIGTDELRAAQKAARDQVVDELAAAGKITAAQAEKLKSQALGGPGAGGVPGQRARAFGARVRGVVENVLSAAANVIGVQPKDVRDGLRKGQSLTQIAGAHGVSRDALKSGLTSRLQAQIAQAAAKGDITQDQANRLTSGLNSRLDQLIDHAATPGAAGGRRFGPMTQKTQ